jgi:Holliday junction resolvase RusA-like endonuclease
MPPSWSRPRQQRAASVRYATGKPDIDNVLKAVLDALKGIAYKDDTMVARIGVVRLWGEADGITVTVTPLQHVPIGTGLDSLFTCGRSVK